MKSQERIKFCWLTTAAVLVAVAIESVGAQEMPEWSVIIPTHNEDAVLRYLRPALMSVGAGRIYYSTVCYDKGEALPFPRLEVQPSPKGLTGLAAVREVFKKDKRVTVTQDQSGMVRIIIGNPDMALLQTRIHSRNLGPWEQYSCSLVIAAIEGSKELEVAKRKLGVDHPLTILSMTVTEPAKGLPHLPKSFKDTTVDQALDLIAKTFGHIVLYGTCADPSGTRLFRFSDAGIAGVVE